MTTCTGTGSAALEAEADARLQRWIDLREPAECDFVGSPLDNPAGRVFTVDRENEGLRRLCPRWCAGIEELFATTGMSEQEWILDQARQAVAGAADMIIQVQKAAVAFLVEDMNQDPDDPAVAREATEFAVFISESVYEHLRETAGTPMVLGFAHIDALVRSAVASDDPGQRDALLAALERAAERMQQPGILGGPSDLVGAVLECEDAGALAALFDAVDRRPARAVDILGDPRLAAQPGVGVRFVDLDAIAESGGQVVRRGGGPLAVAVHVALATDDPASASASPAVRRGGPDKAKKPRNLVARVTEAMQWVASNKFAVSFAASYNLAYRMPFDNEAIRYLIALSMAVALEFGQEAVGAVVSTAFGMLTKVLPAAGPLRLIQPCLSGVIRAMGFGYAFQRKRAEYSLLFSRCASILNVAKTGILIASVCGAFGDPTGWVAGLASWGVAGLDLASVVCSLSSAAPDVRANTAALRKTEVNPVIHNAVVSLANVRGAITETTLYHPRSWDVGSGTHATFLLTRFVSDAIMGIYTILAFFFPEADNPTTEDRLLYASQVVERQHVTCAVVSNIGDLVMPIVIGELAGGRVMSDDVAVSLLQRVFAAAVVLNAVVLVAANERSRRAVLNALIAFMRRCAYVPLSVSWLVHGVVRALSVATSCLNWAVRKGMAAAPVPPAIRFERKRQAEPVRNEALALRVYGSTQVPLAVPAAALDLRLRDEAPAFFGVDTLASTARFEPLHQHHLTGLRPPPKAPCAPGELCAWLSHASNYAMANIAKAARVSTTATELDLVLKWRQKRQQGEHGAADTEKEKAKPAKRARRRPAGS